MRERKIVSEERKGRLKAAIKRVDVFVALIMMILELIMTVLFPWQAWLSLSLAFIWGIYIVLRLGLASLKEAGREFIRLARTMPKKVPKYLRENPGAPFIVAFQIMLITCAILLASGQEEAANGLAVYAFYSLVAGVLLQFAAFLKYGKEESASPEDRAP